MKTSFLALALCFLVSLPVFSQTAEAENPISRRDRTDNELSLNAFNLIVFGALDASYERILSRQTSLSIDLFSLGLNKNEGEGGDLSKAFSKEFSLTTSFKYYFSEKNAAWGFYAEAFAMYSDGSHENNFEFENEDGYVFENEKEFEYQDVALGFGIGNKYVTKGGFVFDLSFGMGRNMFNRYSPDLVVLTNVNFGYRF